MGPLRYSRSVAMGPTSGELQAALKTTNSFSGLCGLGMMASAWWCILSCDDFFYFFYGGLFRNYILICSVAKRRFRQCTQIFWEDCIKKYLFIYSILYPSIQIIIYISSENLCIRECLSTGSVASNIQSFIYSGS